jgi:hypothetical protein
MSNSHRWFLKTSASAQHVALMLGGAAKFHGPASFNFMLFHALAAPPGTTILKPRLLSIRQTAINGAPASSFDHETHCRQETGEAHDKGTPQPESSSGPEDRTDEVGWG